MNSVAKLFHGVAILGVQGFLFCLLAGQPVAGQGLPAPRPDGSEPYQHIPLPKELPKGVSVQDAQHLQSIIDDYRRLDSLTVTKIRGNIYFAKGGTDRNDPNVVFVVSKTSVIVLGTKNTADSQKDVVAEIAKITPNPVKTAILLHGNLGEGVAALPAGVAVIAQETAQKEAKSATTGRGAFPQSYLPTKTIDKDETMTIDGVRVRLLHWAAGCTDGDMVAYFPDKKVVFAGNLLVNDFPLAATAIDGPLHGSVAGWMENIKGMLALNADIYVSGHGPLFTKRAVRTKLAFIQHKWDKIKVMVAQGKSLDEIKAAIGGPPERTPSTTENIYAELTKR